MAIDPGKAERIKAKLEKLWEENIKDQDYDSANEDDIETAGLGALMFAEEIAGGEMMEKYIEGDYGAFI